MNMEILVCIARFFLNFKKSKDKDYFMQLITLNMTVLNTLLKDGRDWSGNDTIWRTVLDLNIIIRYVNKEGVLETKKQRKFFSIIDGIIGGEGDGPLNPTKKKSGVLIVGEELLLVDLI